MRQLHPVALVALSFAVGLAACQKGQDAAPTVTISVSPGSVKVGQNATLTWSATNAATCTASGSWNGTQPAAGSQSLAPTAPGANAYVLLCTGPGGSAANTATLDVNAAPVAHTEPARSGGDRPATACADCGRVSEIVPVKQAGEASGMGAVAGAVLGAVIGHQFGSGRGNSAATAGGAVAGGVGGYEAEKAIRSKTVYQVTVAMDNGSTRKLTLATQEGLTVGAKVRVVGNDVELRD